MEYSLTLLQNLTSARWTFRSTIFRHQLIIKVIDINTVLNEEL